MTLAPIRLNHSPVQRPRTFQIDRPRLQLASRRLSEANDTRLRAVGQLAFGHGRGRYEEAARGHHDHLIDVESGRVIEFRNEAIEALQERIARELGFKLVGHRLELYGVRAKPAKKK